MIYFNGDISLNGIIINPLITLDDFLTLTLDLNPKKMYDFEGRVSYSIDDILFLDKNYIINVVFQDGVIDFINLLPFNKEKENKINVFTNENQMRNKLINDDLLKLLFGSSEKLFFLWGNIESVDDNKSGMSYIIISYKQQ
ncbi:hypothetical protein KKI90_04535 [Xenorhabdus bovienii]|uniref:hypothetical protein n=1 Tax=Xenorhabdus bovienii TaxID=40576 RepID=UPI00237D262C|nr:hypothetical protein [Xenorhabdus bovienii]MDE1475967.1 hypothetical protein [Xenorhabdus bovienii]MDE1485671.1 hypothetical protein [Xenorhabdus bovienii]MDE9459774.1 hypothetical protein [Xenorhabdus bovienii]MDE9476374.1 hypothetical protein [Xenorhabdus bovienii]MDE9486161.1 hypothetical protein [Xenorhabdus bovienii]